jgi:hypothetical protein
MREMDGECDEGPSPPAKDEAFKPSNGVESYFNPLNLSRTNSIYTLSRASFSNQLLQLTSLNLPDANSLSSVVSAIPTAPAATKALANAAVQIQRWIQKAAEVLGGLDAEDDVEWAAAGGREGLGEVDMAIGKFEKLINVYVVAIEELQLRKDIADVPKGELKVVVDTLEGVLAAWGNVNTLLKEVKAQVELAMEWEELWNVVLGDIGLEMENLGRLVFEMEEKRHRSASEEPVPGEHDALDAQEIQELETIAEEAPTKNPNAARTNPRFSLPADFTPSSPLQSPDTPGAPGVPGSGDDSCLLNLFARMQPLRASLDFLPMRLSGFRARAEPILPTACDELDTRRMSLEKRWKALETDAEGLRRELGEDRWVIVFRSAGRKAHVMCQSVQRWLNKLRETISEGAELNNPAALSRSIELYEQKKTNYGPAIHKILSVIEKGIQDRLTINGEVLRIHADTKATWTALEAEIKDMDSMLEDVNLSKSQQLRDSVSSFASNDLSAAGSAIDTPGSSPASSVYHGHGQTASRKNHPLTPEAPATSRRSSVRSTSARPSTARPTATLPNTPTSAAATSRLSRISPMARPSISNLHSPSPSLSHSPAPTVRATSMSTPTPNARARLDTRPRWNTSSKVDYREFGHGSKLLTPPAKPRLPSRHSFSAATQPSPLSRDASASPVPDAHLPRARSRLSASLSSLRARARNSMSPSPARKASGSSTTPTATPAAASGPRFRAHNPQVRASASYSAPQARRGAVLPQIAAQASRGEPVAENEDEAEAEVEVESPSVRSKLARPATALAAGRRGSMLPVPRGRVSSGAGLGSGRDSALGRAGERRWL